jgi:predicted Rossmann fold flavoprotein
MSERCVVVAGGGAAGFFAAITCAESFPKAKVILLEKSPRFLAKVRISGGGRCNVTHACFDARELSDYYPRGGDSLRGPFTVFQPRDTIEWFEGRGVKLKVEKDGRIFPVSNSSQTIIDCLLHAAEQANVDLMLNRGIEHAARNANGGFELKVTKAEKIQCDRLLIAIGGCRTAAAGQLAVALGHTLELPVPSLFTFHIPVPWLQELAGVSVESAEVSVPAMGLRERGPMLMTHAGLSGPVILRLSAWGAKALHSSNYQFTTSLNWLPHLDAEGIAAELKSRRTMEPAKLVVNTPLTPLAARLWERLVLASGIARETRWASLSRSAQQSLIHQLSRMELPVNGKTLNQDEFVTCGGVRLNEVNFKTMESRICKDLYFAGEVLDIDGLTGGFNFQAAWTTGWIAGRAMARD